MKQKLILHFIFILLVGFIFLVSARMTFLYPYGGGIYNVYENDIPIKEGWNLIKFGIDEEERDGNEILNDDIKAIYYYNPNSKSYVRYFPENEEMNNLISDLATQDTCGDTICSVEERENYSSWCPKDCNSPLSEDIIRHLDVILTKELTLNKNEKALINFNKFDDLEFYWNQESILGNCKERGYFGDCVMLHYNITSSGLEYYHEFTNSPDDGNPNNDDFGKFYLISPYIDTESDIYAKVEYGGNSDEYVITIYEIDDPKVKKGNYGFPTIISPLAKFLDQPACVYSTKMGLLKTKASFSIKIDKNQLQPGWNFVTITPEFDDQTWNQTSRYCNVLKAYIFDAEKQRWVDLNSMYGSNTFDDNVEGQGIVVKVSDRCYLSTRVGIEPPEIP